MRPRIMVIEENAHNAGLLANALRQRGYAAEAVGTPTACLDRLATLDSAVVLIDVAVTNGLELCQQVRDHHAHVLPIALTARREVDVAIAAMRAGAYDYLTKPVSVPVLELALTRALCHLNVQCELDRLQHQSGDAPITELVTASPALQHTLELVRRIAPSDTTVLITGESGVGKERIAAEIHRLSDRKDEPFVAIDCSAMTVTLLESELFGHVRGAFTGAERERMGLLLRAGRGTILLDELADMPLEMQAKLLRVLQERTVRPLGADAELPLQARIIAATSRDLEAEVAAKRFRKDLYHRINVVAVQVPPLRQRQEDILMLAHALLRRCAARINKPVNGMTAPTARLLLEYEWPGNVRELENCMERAVAVCRLDQITVDDLPERLRSSCGSLVALTGGSPEGFVTLAKMKLTYLRTALALCHGNKSLAARMLDIDRRTISNVLVGAKPPTSQMALEIE